MRAIIPVAGEGTRLRPHTFTQPKVLLNVAGKPMIAHIMDKIIEEGIKKATIIVGHLGDKIKTYLESHYDIEMAFVNQEELRGLGHAIYISRDTFGKDPLFIILGDTLFDVNLKSTLKGKVTSLGVKEVEDPARFGVAVVENGQITRLVEKPKSPVSNLALVGLYYIQNTELLTDSLSELIDKDIKTRGEFQLTDALQLMIDKGEKMTTFPVDGWYDCGKPETLLSTNRELLDKMRINTEKNTTEYLIRHPVYISPTATITDSVIGPYATISDNSLISNSIIKNSIIGTGSKIRNAVLEDSIIGEDADIKGYYKKLNIGDKSEAELP